MIGVITLILTTVAALAAFLLGVPGLDGEKISLSLSDDGCCAAWPGGVYLGLVAVFGIALGVLLRSSAGAIAALVGILLILPGLASLLPDSRYDYGGTVTIGPHETGHGQLGGVVLNVPSEQVVLTGSTIKKHVGRVLAKIGARDRIQAFIMAYEAGLVRAKP